MTHCCMMMVSIAFCNNWRVIRSSCIPVATFFYNYGKMIPSSVFREFFDTFSPFLCNCLKPFTVSGTV